MTMKIMKMMMMKPPQNGPTLYCKRYLSLTFLNLFSFLLSLSLIGVSIMMMKIEAGSDRVVQSVPLHISLVHISHHISLCPLPILLYYTVCTATNLSSYVFVSPRFHLPDGHQTLTREHTVFTIHTHGVSCQSILRFEVFTWGTRSLRNVR